jgi:8-oxoguanine DNA glycosylase-like protein
VSSDAIKNLVRRYASVPERPVRYRPHSWASKGEADYALLWDSNFTSEAKNHPSDRLINAKQLQARALLTKPEDEAGLRQLFVLVMAWGTGTSNPRSYRNTRIALADPRLDEALKSTATLCRGDRLGDTAAAYAAWQVSGIRRSYFTKWFRFAGHVADREWQPLILDDRVLQTLYVTLGIRTKDLTDSRFWRDRYTAYVATVHSWAEQLGDVSAQRIEWVLFMHNGRDHPDAPLSNR